MSDQLGTAAPHKNIFADIDPQVQPAAPAAPDHTNIFADMDLPPVANDSTGAGAFVSHAIRGALPAAGGLAAAGTGAEIGGVAGGAIAGPPGAMVGGFVGGLGAFFAGSAAVGAAQDWALHQLPDSWQEALGQSDREQRLQEERHPVYSFLGGIAPYALTATPGALITKAADLPAEATALQRIMANPVTARAFGGAAMGGMELGQEEYHGETPSWAKIAISTGFGLVFNQPTRFGEYLTGTGARVLRAFQTLDPARPTVNQAAAIARALRAFQKMLDPARPTVNQAADLGVMGPGITESTFHGGTEQSDATRTTAQNAAADEQALLGPLPQPDLHAVARRMEPELFGRRDQLEAQRDGLRAFIADASNPTDETLDTLASKRSEVDAALRASNPRSPDAQNYRAQLADIDAQQAELTARRESWASGQHVETPEITLARQHLLDTEHALWDLGPEISAAMRRAADHAGQVEEAAPAAEAAAPAPAAEAPAAEAPAAPAPAVPWAPPVAGVPWAPPIFAAPPFDIVADRTAQLMAAGMSREHAEVYATAEAEFYKRHAARFGGALGTAEDLYRARAPRAQGQSGAVASPEPSAPAAPAAPAVSRETAAVAPEQPAALGPRPRVRTAAEIMAEDKVGPGKVGAIQKQEMVALFDWQAQQRDALAPPAPLQPQVPAAGGRPAMRTVSQIMAEDRIGPVAAQRVQHQEMIALADWHAAQAEPFVAASTLAVSPEKPNIPDHTDASGAGGLESLDPASIGVDAERFQFKAGGDEAGITERLEGVQKWDPRMAGTLLVFRDADGKNWIADGHQRLGLAMRLIAEGQTGIRLNAFVLDAKDGLTDGYARVVAAAKNIAEGTGTAVDAAKIMREAADQGIELPALPPKSTLVRDGRALARLSADAFGMVVNDVVPVNQGAVVGRLVSDPAEQAEAMRVLAKSKPENIRQAEIIVRTAMETMRDVAAVGTLAGPRQKRLFDDEDLKSSAVLERAKVADEAMRQLTRDRTTFRTLVGEAERIQGHGENVLDIEANRGRLTADEQAKQLLTQLATRRGPVSDALTGIARRLQSGDISAAAGAREFLEIVRREVESGVERWAGAGGPVAGAERELTQPAADEGPTLFQRPVQPIDVSDAGPGFLEVLGGLSAPRRADPRQGDMFLETPKTMAPQAATEPPPAGKLIGNAGEDFARYAETQPGAHPHDLAAGFPVERGRASGTEHLAGITMHGENVVVAHSSGQHNFVEFPPVLVERMSDPNESLILHHNHPSNSALSAADIKTLAYPGVSHVVAHGHDGTMYAASFPDNLRAERVAGDMVATSNAVDAMYQRASAEVIRYLSGEMSAGRLDMDAANKISWDAVNRALHKAGLIDYMTTREYPADLVQFVDGAVSAALKKATNDRTDRPSVAVRSAEGNSRVLENARRIAAAGRPVGEAEPGVREAGPAAAGGTGPEGLEAGRRIPQPPAAGAPLLGEPAPEPPEPAERREPPAAIADKAALERQGQAVLPGMEASAVQAQAARDQAGPRGGQQAANEGLFAPKTAEERTLFQRLRHTLDQAARGKIVVSPGDVRSIITSMRAADPSTFMHELSHDWLKQMLQDSLHPLAPQDLRDDAAIIRRWLKRPDGWTGFDARGLPETRPHEKFATTFEQWLREGVAPSAALARVFAKLKEWMGAIYGALKKVPGSDINDDIRGVFDRMFTAEPRRTVYAPEREVQPSLATIHEADAAETEPHEAEAVGDRVVSERDRHIATNPPEIANAHEAAAPAAPEATEPAAGGPAASQPAGEAGAGAGGPGEVAGGGGASGPVAGGSAGGTAGRPVERGRSEALPESPRLPGSEQRRGGGAGPGPEQFAPKPAERLPDAEPKLVDLAGNIRVENLTNQEDIAQAIHDSADRNDGFRQVRGGMTKGQMFDLAEAMGLDPNKIDEATLARMFGGTQELGAKILAARRLVVQSAGIVSNAMKIAAESGADRDVAALGVAIARHDMIQSTLSGVTAEWGRAGNAFHSLLEGWQSAQDLNQLLRDNLGRDLFQLKMIAKLGARMDTPGKVSKLLRDAQERSFGRMILEYWINGLISGLSTHVTYMVGNAVLAAQKAGPETAAAWAIGALQASRGRVGERVHLGEVGAQFRAAGREMPAALQAALEAYRSGATTLLPGEAGRPRLPLQGDTELAVSRGMTNAHVTWGELKGDAYATIQGMRDGLVAAGELVAAGGDPGAPMLAPVYTPGAQIPDIAVRGVTVPVGTLARLPSRNVAAIHSTFRALNYSMEINRLAYRQAASEGLAGTALDARVADIRQNPTEEMMASARGTATDLTLMGEAGKWVKKLSEWVNTPINLPILGETPVMKFVDPFVHIAAQIMDQSLMQRTPIGLLSSEIRADLSGKNGNIAQDTASAKMLIGSALATAFGGLAAQGLASGSGPADPNKAAMWRLAGNQAHSVRVGDIWYDVHRLGPMGMLLSVAADMYDVAHQIGTEDADVVGKSLMHAFAQNILDESFMRGPADLIRALTDPDRYGAGYVRTFLSSFMPYSVGMAQMARATDLYSRQARTIMDAVRQKTPGLSEALFPRRDIWGEPMPSGDALVAPGVTAIYATRMSTDPVNLAMVQLGIGPAPVKQSIRNVKLTDQQYDDFARIAGRLVKMRLDAIVRSPDYQSWSNSTRHDVIEEVIKQNREVAAGRIMMQYPQIPHDATLQQQARHTGEPTPIE